MLGGTEKDCESGSVVMQRVIATGGGGRKTTTKATIVVGAVRQNTNTDQKRQCRGNAGAYMKSKAAHRKSIQVEKIQCRSVVSKIFQVHEIEVADGCGSGTCLAAHKGSHSMFPLERDRVWSLEEKR